jgi:LacI family transcriptional regulator
MPKKVTLKDLAAEAGVSLMTVSNVINGNHARVSEATLARVREIVDQRGYVANASARSLAASSSHMIGLLVPSSKSENLLDLNPHAVQLFGFLERALRQRGYHLLFRGISELGDIDVATRSWNLDGTVLLSFIDEDVDRLGPEHETPIVALDSYSANPHTTGVRSDDYAGGRLAAEHLLALGHRRIGFASPGFTEVGLVRQRFNGFKAALDSAGVRWNPRDRFDGAVSWDAGYALGRRMARRASRPSAVFATADILAAGIVAGLQAEGLSVPHDMSVVGFDDIDLARYVTPALTTVRQDVEAKGTYAAGLLLEEISGERPPGQAVVIPVDLLTRGSTGPAPA